MNTSDALPAGCVGLIPADPFEGLAPCELEALVERTRQVGRPLRKQRCQHQGSGLYRITYTGPAEPREIIAWVLDRGYRNILIELNNECDVKRYDHEILKPKRVHELIERVKKRVKGGRRLLVSTSYGGGTVPGANVIKASDFVLLHGNGLHKPEQITEQIKPVADIFTPIFFVAWRYCARRPFACSLRKRRMVMFSPIFCTSFCRRSSSAGPGSRVAAISASAGSGAAAAS